MVQSALRGFCRTHTIDPLLRQGSAKPFGDRHLAPCADDDRHGGRTAPCRRSSTAAPQPPVHLSGSAAQPRLHGWGSRRAFVSRRSL
jgi:hypothetical protein